VTSLEDLGKSLSGAVKRLLRLPLIDEKAVEELVKDLQRALLQSDVNVKLVLEISERVFERSIKEKIPAGISRREHVIKVLYEELTRFLGEKPSSVSIPQKKPYVLMLIGIQGSGKTTGAVKIGRFYQKRGLKVALVCADTYRPGAYEQLKQLADKVNIPVYWDEKKSPESIAVEAVSKFAKEGYHLIVIDTAGRHKNEKELMDEMRRLEHHIKPDEVMLVLDGTIGQQALSHAEAFQNATRVGSIYVTKLDGSARGGGALSAVAATQAKVKFIGVGEKIDDIEPFDPARFVGRLLGMGDLETLIEKVKEAEVEPLEKKTRALVEGKFTLKDLYEQVESMRKLGPLKKILGMMPGGLSVDAEQLNLAEKKFKDWRVIIQSMRSDEIEDPRIVDSSRARRIARGSGKTERDVKELIEQYFAMKKMVKTLRKRHGILQKKFLFDKNIKAY
jgi:signal recognition particle subunit SRP54